MKIDILIDLFIVMHSHLYSAVHESLLTAVSHSFAEITGPIILETYRAIADFKKSSKYELSLMVGDLLEIVEKTPNGELRTRAELCEHCSSFEHLMNVYQQ